MSAETNGGTPGWGRSRNNVSHWELLTAPGYRLSQTLAGDLADKKHQTEMVDLYSTMIPLK